MPGDDTDLEFGLIPQPWQCFHDDPSEIIKVYKNDSELAYAFLRSSLPSSHHPNYLKCMMCGDEFSTIGDTAEWKPVWVDYDMPL